MGLKKLQTPHRSAYALFGGPLSHRNLRVSLAFSDTEIGRKGFLMSAVKAIPRGLKQTSKESAKGSGFRLVSVSGQSLSDGWPLWEDVPNTTGSRAVFLYSLSAAWWGM